MLRPEEFHAGDLTNATEDGLTLVLPRSEYEHAGLIGRAFEGRYGVTLSGDLPFQAYVIKDDEPWSGILVPNVRIEVDEMTCYDPAAQLEVGSVIRDPEGLSIVGITGPHLRTGRPIAVVIATGLPPSAARERAGFGKWRIVIGHGEDTRELIKIDATEVARIRVERLS